MAVHFRRLPDCRKGRLGALEQGHKAVVHVQLLVAVKKRKPRLICGEVDLHFLETPNHDHIFVNACRRLSRDLCQFKNVPMQVHRMDIVAGISHF